MQATLRRTEIRRPVLPLLELLDPREHTRTILVLLAVGVAGASAGMRWWGLPLWGATVAVLLLLLPPAILKWRGDLRRYGMTVTVISVLLVMQGFHSVEHAAQR